MKSLFRYCGNKGRLLGLYRKPPSGTKRIVEPYLGGGSFSLNYDFPVLGIDQDERVVGLWNWLKTIKPVHLSQVETYLESQRVHSPKLDVRTLNLTPGATLYIKINVCGLVVGQWSSWSLYPQHRLPIERTLEALPRVAYTEVLHGDASLYLGKELEGDLAFLDPPYHGTSANYHKEGGYKPQDTLDLLDRMKKVPVIFTYGDGAAEVFPGLPWEKVKERKVPNFRNGGTVSRTEYVAYLNWPEEPSTLSMFGVQS